MAGQEAALASALEGLREELRGSLGRMEEWGNENSALRRALRAELQRAQLGGGPESASAHSLAVPPSCWRSTPPPGDGDGRGAQAHAPSQAAPDVPQTTVSSVSLPTPSSPWVMRDVMPGDVPPTPLPEFSTTWRKASWRLLHRHGTAFDSAIGLAILASSVTVGVDIQCDLDGNVDCSRNAHNLEHLFLVIFILELLIRAFADGWAVLKSGWFRFDLILVVLGVFFAWVVEPIVLYTSIQDSVWLDIISKVLILRTLRLTRLVRALRLFEQFQEMWKLANGLMRSFRTVISACIMIFLTIYLFACVGIELIARDASLLEDPVTADVVQENFPSLQMTMVSLVQFANADGIASVYKPIVEKAWHLGFYFAFVWLVVTIKLMNLITAVIVDNAITQGDVDREMELDGRRKRLRALKPNIDEIWQLLDKSGTGKLSLSEFRSGLKGIQAASMKHLPADLVNILASDSIVEVCDYLDADRSGEIDESEFIDGIFSLMLQSVPIETTQMLQLLRSQSHVLRRIQKRIMPLSSRRHGEDIHRQAGETDAAGASAPA